MQKYLFSFIELFSFMGMGTPEHPGGDFSMQCWIEAKNEEEALNWGHVLLGDYYKARFAHSESRDHYDGSPVKSGDIVDDPELMLAAGKHTIPTCRVGEIPIWDEPWRISNVR